MATSDKEKIEGEVKEMEGDEEHENKIDKDDDEFIVTQDIIHNNSDDDGVTTANNGIMSGEDVNISKNFDDRRKGGSGGKNPEEGKEQKMMTKSNMNRSCRLRNRIVTLQFLLK